MSENKFNKYCINQQHNPTSFVIWHNVTNSTQTILNWWWSYFMDPYCSNNIEIPENIDKLENIDLFNDLIEEFIKNTKCTSDKNQVFENTNIYTEFKIFLLKTITTNIDSQNWNRLNKLIEDFEVRYNLKKYYIEIPEGTTKIEETPFFDKILELFIEEKNSPYQKKDIGKITKMYDSFRDYITELSFKGQIAIDDITYSRYEALITDFRIRKWFHVKWIVECYDRVVSTIFPDYEKNNEFVRVAMLNFLTAYHLVKQVFSWKKRETTTQNWEKERAFEHPKWVMKIILDELPNPDLIKIIIALLHDVIEDIPWMTEEILEEIFLVNVAEWVKELSKIDWRLFLEEDEYNKIKEYEDRYSENELKGQVEYLEIKWKAKEKRNETYFGRLDELKERIFDAKCADRIHNLRTLGPMSAYKKAKKIIETKKYFMDEALKRKRRQKKEWIILWKWRHFAYDIMQAEMNEWLKDKEVLEEYNKQINEEFYRQIEKNT